MTILYPDAEPVCLAILNYVRQNQQVVITEMLADQAWKATEANQFDLFGYTTVQYIEPIQGFEINSGDAVNASLPCLTVYPPRTTFPVLINEETEGFIDHNLILQVSLGEYDPKDKTQMAFLYTRLLYNLIVVQAARAQYKALNPFLERQKLRIMSVTPVDLNYFTPGLTQKGVANNNFNFHADPQLGVRVRCKP